MAANKYLSFNTSTGKITEVQATVTGGSAGDDGKIVALTSAGRLDTSIMPVGIGADTYANTAGEALTAGDFCYIAANGSILKSSAASGGNDAQGFVLASSSSGANATLYFEGRNTSLSSLTPGVRYYLHSSTAGALQNSAPTGSAQRVQFLGRAVSATSLDFEPDDSIVLA